MTTLELVANVPLTLGVLALATERVRKLAARSLPAASLLVPACWLIRAADVGQFDPVGFAVTVLLSVGSVLALSRVAKGDPRFTVIDLLVATALFLPLDMRWTNRITPGGHGGYDFWAIGLTYLALLGWACPPRELPELGHRPPGLRDLKIGLLALLAFGAVVIPVGFAMGFLKGAPNLTRLDGAEAALMAVGIALFVALPEELIFRGILDRGLQKTLRSPKAALVVSSLLFGLMHFPRRDKWQEKLAYVVIASIAGVFYGLAYRIGRGLPAAVLCHATVDWAWFHLWKR